MSEMVPKYVRMERLSAEKNHFNFDSHLLCLQYCLGIHKQMMNDSSIVFIDVKGHN